MYTRTSRRLYQIFISSSFLRRNSSLDPSCRQFIKIISDRLTETRLYSNSPYRETDTKVHCENRMAHNEIDYQQLLEAQKDANVLIIDVREQNEINETGKLPGSIHIPMADVRKIFLNLSQEEFKKRYGKCKPDKDTKIIISCRSGKRSAAVQDVMHKLGYTNTYNYIGGWLDWENKQKGN